MPCAGQSWTTLSRTVLSSPWWKKQRDEPPDDVEALHHEVVSLDLDGVGAALDTRAHARDRKAYDPDRAARPCPTGSSAPTNMLCCRRPRSTSPGRGVRHRLSDLREGPRRAHRVRRRVGCRAPEQQRDQQHSGHRDHGIAAPAGCTHLGCADGAPRKTVVRSAGLQSLPASTTGTPGQVGGADALPVWLVAGHARVGAGGLAAHAVRAEGERPSRCACTNTAVEATAPPRFAVTARTTVAVAQPVRHAASPDCTCTARR